MIHAQSMILKSICEFQMSVKNKHIIVRENSSLQYLADQLLLLLGRPLIRRIEPVPVLVSGLFVLEPPVVCCGGIAEDVVLRGSQVAIGVSR